MPSVQTAGAVAVCGVLKLCQNKNHSGITATYTVRATHAPMTTQLQSNVRRLSLRLAMLGVLVVVVVMVRLVMPLDLARGLVLVMMMLVRDARILTEDK